jgi:hypothetical protein
MLAWLFGRKKPSDLPWYSVLKAVPTRGIPDELAAQENREFTGGELEALQCELLDPPRRPRDDAPLFTELAQGKGLVTCILPDGVKQCLLVFSTSIRAADYARTQLTTGPRAQYLVSSPLQLLKILAGLRKAGVESLALDRCPRCRTFSVVSLDPLASADTVLKLWAIHKATEILRTNLYFAYALKSARAGRLEVARDIALEAIGHVTLEDPRLHFLLGQLALGLSDRVLLREARAHMAFFGQDMWEQRLARSVRSGSPEFVDFEQIAGSR